MKRELVNDWERKMLSDALMSVDVFYDDTAKTAKYLMSTIGEDAGLLMERYKYGMKISDVAEEFHTSPNRIIQRIYAAFHLWNSDEYYMFLKHGYDETMNRKPKPLKT